MPLDRVGCYVPGGRYPLPSSLLMTAIPARVAGRAARSSSACPRPHPVVLAAALEAGVDRAVPASAARTRWRRWPTAPRTVPRVDKIVGPGNRWVAAAKALVSARLRHRLLRRADRDPDRRRRRAGRVDRRRSDRAGRARSRRARGAASRRAARLAQRGRRARSTAQLPADGPAARVAAAPRRHHRHAHRWPKPMALANAAAPEHLVVETEALAARSALRRRGLRRAVDGAGGRRLRHRIEPRAADRGRRALSRRPERRRLRAAGVGAAA